jgi:hypothetical protein
MKSPEQKAAEHEAAVSSLREAIRVVEHEKIEWAKEYIRERGQNPDSYSNVMTGVRVIKEHFNGGDTPEERIVNTKMTRALTRLKHATALWEIGISYADYAAMPNPKIPDMNRISHCFQCKRDHLNYRTDLACKRCKGIVCPQCGACPCTNK